MQNEREWDRFCDQVLGHAELARDPRFDTIARRSENRQALRALILKVFAGLSTEQVGQRLDRAQIANARMNTMAEVWAHPQLQARGRLSTIGSPAGPLPAFLPPASQSGFAHHMGPVPQVGEHNEAILRELGMRL